MEPAPEPSALFHNSPRAWQARYQAARAAARTDDAPRVTNQTRHLRRKRVPRTVSGFGQESTGTSGQ
jgi:hypothetical protein